MVVNTISDAKAHFSALIERVQQGEEVVIKKAGQPVAVIHRYTERKEPLEPGALRGRIRVSDDFDVLPDEIASVFGMKE
jgi:prevent-host-death family protein